MTFKSYAEITDWQKNYWWTQKYNSIIKNKTKAVTTLWNEEITHWTNSVTLYLLSHMRKYQSLNPKLIRIKLNRIRFSHLTINQELVIKDADKGSNSIIINVENYKSAILSLIQDSASPSCKTLYEKSTNYQWSETMDKLQTHIYKYQTSLTNKEYDYLTRFDSQNSLLYGLPKFYKKQ